MIIEHKKNTAHYLAVPMVDASSPASFKSGETVVDTAYSKDGTDAWASLDISDTFAEIGSTGIYEIDLAAGEMNHDYVLIKLTSTNSADSFVLFRMHDGDIDDAITDIGIVDGIVDTIDTNVDDLTSDVSDLTSDVADNQTDLDALLAIMGAITGSGDNTVLGLFKATLNKAAATPSDVGGTFDPATDSQEAIAEGAQITVGPLVAGTLPDQQVGSGTRLEMFEGESRSKPITVQDSNDDDVDLSGKTLRFVVEDDEGTRLDTVENADITVSGSGNQIANPFIDGDFGSGAWLWKLWDVTTTDQEYVLVHGDFILRASSGDGAAS